MSQSGHVSKSIFWPNRQARPLVNQGWTDLSYIGPQASCGSLPWTPEGAQGIDPHQVSLWPPTLGFRPRAAASAAKKTDVVAAFLAADATDVLAADTTDVLPAAKAASGSSCPATKPMFNSKANVE